MCVCVCVCACGWGRVAGFVSVREHGCGSMGTACIYLSVGVCVRERERESREFRFVCVYMYLLIGMDLYAGANHEMLHTNTVQVATWGSASGVAN